MSAVSRVDDHDVVGEVNASNTHLSTDSDSPNLLFMQHLTSYQSRGVTEAEQSRQTHLSHDALLAGLARSLKRRLGSLDLPPLLCEATAIRRLCACSFSFSSRAIRARTRPTATALATRKHVQTVNRDFYSSYATTIFHCLSVNNS